MNNKLIIVASLCVFLASCKNNKQVNETSDIQQKNDTVYVSESSVVNSKIKLYTVTKRYFSAEFNTTGEVKAITGQIAEIAPPFDGRVGKLLVQLGQKVNAGTPVFELYSGEFFDATKNYFQTVQTKKIKELNLQRQKDLVKNGVGVAKELEEAETDYEIALKDYETATAVLKMFNIDINSLTMGQALEVVSPIAGEVVQTNIVIGQFVKSDAAPLSIVAELSKVWVVAQVKEKYINYIQSDDKVEIYTDSDPKHIIGGHVSHISELLDEETRSVQVFITCDNKDRKLKPGMFTNVHFINVPKESIVVPSSALLQREDESYVFIQDCEGKYIKRSVIATTVSGTESLINEGLNAGDIIVSEGGIYLKAN